MHVPGDYATVQGAVNALVSCHGIAGGTICLGPQAFAENVSIPNCGGSQLTIQGTSAGQTKLTSLGSSFPEQVVLRGLTVTNTVGCYQCGGMTIEASTLRCAGANNPALNIDTSDETITLDGDDVSCSGGDAITVSVPSEPGALTVLVQNSYVHDSTVGIESYLIGCVSGQLGCTGAATASVTVKDSTFTNNATAIDVSIDTLGLAGGEAYLYNDIFVGNTTGINIGTGWGEVGANNALSGNTANYAGAAAPGPGYVTSNPLLDTSTTPPGLLPGSPCIGAGDASHAPATDYFGNPRYPGKADIGAVQSWSQAIAMGGTYAFVTGAHAGSCMDAQGGGTADGTQIQELACDGAAEQQLRVQAAGYGSFNLVNVNANKCVDVQGGGTADGTKIQLYDCNQSGGQSFVAEDAGSGFVYLVDTNSGKCLDVQGGSPADGTVVQLHTCNQTSEQQWSPQ